MDKTREEFNIFIRQALADRNSTAFGELYQFLVNAFIRADSSKSGQVNPDDFDTLIEEAAALPRKFGYAPKSEEMYPTEDARKQGRKKLFDELDKDGNGLITLDEWVTYALSHIAEKAKRLPKEVLLETGDNVSKDDFLNFIRKAVDKSTVESNELYYFLVNVFLKADTERVGRVGPQAFDIMIEEAANAPRRFGLAPSTDSLFPNAQARFDKRKEYFKEMDKDKNGTISLDEWVTYALNHIQGKVNSL